MFQTIIVRTPGENCGAGLTSVDLGTPDPILLRQQWEYYVKTIEDLDVDVVVLPALSDLADSYFVEDVAVVTPEIAVITRPGADSRRPEAEHMVETLKSFRAVARIEAPGTLDGGDVLVVGKHCIIGLSERTNRSGAEQLCHYLEEHGYRGDIVEVPEALHFKSSVNFVDEETLLVTSSCANLECLAGYRLIVVPDGENYAANVVWMNGQVLMPEGYPGVRALLIEHGANVIEMPVSEIAKMDGGLTCLSLRLTA